jgi:hypothetical protein
MGKKSNRKRNQQAEARDEEDFVRMLAELRASDLATAPTSTSSTTTTPTTSTASSSLGARMEGLLLKGPPPNPAPRLNEEIKVSEEGIIKACKRGDIKKWKHLERQGVLIHNGNPLFYAVLLEKLDVVRCLVKDLGADVNQANDESCLPTDLAAELDRLYMERFEAGGVSNQGGHYGSTPLIYAALQGHMEMIRRLAELGANANQAEQNGCTPLIVAAQEGNLEVVRFLVREIGADVNQTKMNGATPLMVASMKKRADVVAWLVKAGADLMQSLRGGYHCTAANFSRAGKPSRPRTWRPSRTDPMSVAAVRAS